MDVFAELKRGVCSASFFTRKEVPEMIKILNGFLLVFALLAASAAAEESVVSDQAAIARFQPLIFWDARSLELNKPSIMNMVPPERLSFWNALLPAIESSLSQRHDEALAQFDRLLTEYPRSGIGDLNHVFLLRLHGVVLGKSGDYSAAVQVYDDLLLQYGDNPDVNIRWQVAYAMNHRAVTLGDAGDFEGKIRAFDALNDVFKSAIDADMRNFMIASGFMKSRTYEEEGYFEEARRTLQETIAAFPGPQPDRKAIVHIMTGLSLLNNNQAHAPIDTLSKEVKSRLGQPSPPPSPEEIEANGILLKAKLLSEKRDPQAFTLFNELIEKHRDSENGKTRNIVAFAMIGKTNFLESLGDDAAAVEAYHDFDAWAGTEKASETQSTIAMGMFFRGTYLGRAGDRQEAVNQYDKIIARFKDVDDDMVQQMVATALYMKATTLDELGEAEAAYAVVTELVETYRTHSFFGARTMAERAEPLRKKLARQLGK
jgi:tetratricopeptide (TPR) repeat protein